MNSSGGRVLTVALCLAALASCTSGEQTSSSTTTRPKAVTTTTRPGQVVVSTSTIPDSPDGETAADLLVKAESRLPYPDDVLDCVAQRASEDADLRAALEQIDKAASLVLADEAAAACVVEVRTGPGCVRFFV